MTEQESEQKPEPIWSLFIIDAKKPEPYTSLEEAVKDYDFPHFVSFIETGQTVLCLSKIKIVKEDEEGESKETFTWQIEQVPLPEIASAIQKKLNKEKEAK